MAITATTIAIMAVATVAMMKVAIWDTIAKAGAFLPWPCLITSP
ncbi:MAG: hypothetical protein ABIO88_05500 [Burkholderiaceae bacterium]